MDVRFLWPWPVRRDATRRDAILGLAPGRHLGLENLGSVKALSDDLAFI